MLVDQRVDTLIEPIGRFHIDHDDKNSTLRKGDIALVAQPLRSLHEAQSSGVGCGETRLQPTIDLSKPLSFLPFARQVSASLHLLGHALTR